MARPRTPSNILELRGTFKKDAKRTRTDAKGSAPFEKQPPTHLPESAVPAWRYIVARLPLVALYNCDEIAVEVAARLLSSYWLRGDLDTAKELRLWLAKLGMTPQDRTRIDALPPDETPDDPAAKYLY